MACMTLKRSLDFDPVHSVERTPKRRRCIPLTTRTPPSSKKVVEQQKHSLFGDVSTKLTPDQVAANIREEMKRLARRRQLIIPSACGSSNSQSENEDTISPPHSPNSADYASSSSKRDQPLFTFRQVELICERMWKERENNIREEYDKVLTTKLAEQYDLFVKFTHDQIQKKFEGATASYLS